MGGWNVGSWPMRGCNGRGRESNPCELCTSATRAMSFQWWTKASPPCGSLLVRMQPRSNSSSKDRINSTCHKHGHPRPRATAKDTQPPSSQPRHNCRMPHPWGHLRHVPFPPSFPFGFPFDWKDLKGTKVAVEREPKETKGKMGHQQAFLGRDERRKRHVDGYAGEERSCRILRASCTSRKLLPGRDSPHRAEAASINDGESTWLLPSALGKQPEGKRYGRGEYRNTIVS